MLKLSNRNETPSEEFQYTFHEDGHRVRSFSHDGWLRAIKAHAKDNGYTPPTTEEAEHQLCTLLPPGWCKQEDGSLPERYVNVRMGLADIINGTKVLAAFVLAGAPLVAQEVAESRAKICAGCPYNVAAVACGACHGLSNLVEEVAAQKTTRADAQLATKSCAVCKCLSRAHVWLRPQELVKGITPEMREQFSGISWCWKREVSELDNQCT